MNVVKLLGINLFINMVASTHNIYHKLYNVSISRGDIDTINFIHTHTFNQAFKYHYHIYPNILQIYVS
jgi:hypothetical protein